jgi:hypothetical protein
MTLLDLLLSIGLGKLDAQRFSPHQNTCSQVATGGGVVAMLW